MTSLVVQNRVGTIIIDNQKTRNALDDATRKSLLAALRKAVGDPECIALILKGAGDTFCSGGDLSSMPTDEQRIRLRLGEMHEIVRIVHAGPKPIVSVVDGAAFGSGFSLAIACDYVIATERARFGCSFGRVGLVADTGLIWTLTRRVGAGAARAILLEGRSIGAKEGYGLGLVDEVAGSDHLDRAERWAGAFAESAPLAVGATKRLLANVGGSFDEFLSAEVEAQISLLASADFTEGRSAFFERRPPVFGSRA